ncbi:hypothetical protein AAG906_014453 [Vitis piasezkii]
MMKQLFSSTLLGMIFLLLCTSSISGQSLAPAQAPSGSTTTSGQSSPPTQAPSGPADIIAVLTKAGKFTTFIGLLKSSQVDSLINTQLKKPGNGFTVFAPTDSAFSNLKTGTLNSFTDEQKAALTKFHIIPSFLTIAQFQTVSNPVHTSASGDSVEFPLNVIGNGTQVNMTTGLVNTTVDSTAYSDGQLAVYEIPQVLISQGILNPQAPAPAPLPPKPKKAAPLNALSPSRSTTVSVDSSGATGLLHYAPTVASIGVAVLAAMSLSL